MRSTASGRCSRRTATRSSTSVGWATASGSKLINNLVFTVNLRTALAAAELGESMGVPSAELSRVLSECSGGCFAINLFQHMPPESLAGGARHYLIKDVTTIRDVAGEQGIELGLLGELANWVFE